jgi:hypothetical protein
LSRIVLNNNSIKFGFPLNINCSDFANVVELALLKGPDSPAELVSYSDAESRFLWFLKNE